MSVRTPDFFHVIAAYSKFRDLGAPDSAKAVAEKGPGGGVTYLVRTTPVPK